MTEKEKTAPENRRELLIEVSRQRLTRLRDKLALVHSKLASCPESDRARWDLAAAELTKSFEQEQSRIAKLEGRQDEAASSEIEVLTPSFEIDLASVTPAPPARISAAPSDKTDRTVQLERKLEESRRAEQSWKTEKAQLLTNIDQLELQIEEISFELTAQSQLRDSLEAQLASVSSVDRAGAALESEIEQLKKQVAELNQFREAEAIVRVSLEQQVAQLKDKHEAQLAILFDQEDAHALDKSEIERQMLEVKGELQAKITELEKQLTEAGSPSSDSKNNDSAAEIARLTKKLAEAGQQTLLLKEEHGEEVAELTQQLSQAEQELLRRTQEHITDTAELHKQLEERPAPSSPTTEVSELKEENERYQVQNTLLQERLDEYFNELERRLGELQELRPLVAAAEASTKNFEDEIKALGEKLVAAQSGAEELEELRLWKQRELGRQDELQRDLEAAQQLVDEAVERKIVEATEYRQSVERLEAQLAEAHQTLHVLNDEHNKLQKLMSEREALVAELQSNHTSSQDSHALLQAEVEQREARVSEIDAAMKELQRKHEELEEALALRERELFLLRPLAEGPIDD